jgi:selenide,water dikinase
VPGAQQHSIPVKPISRFWSAWTQQQAALMQADMAQDIAVVGGGAGSVELILAMAYALRNAPVRHRFHLVSRGEHLLPGYPQIMLGWLRHRFEHYAINLHVSADVVAVNSDQLLLRDGRVLAASTVFWCTQARTAPWLADAQLDLTAQGFVRVTPSLQSLDWPNVFAAGDCAWIDATPTPRAGVYAVRQAPVLADNLRRACRGTLTPEGLRHYHPQRHFLSLLATGSKDAVGARGSLPLAGAWVWRWKDRIDRRFMTMLKALPVQPPPHHADNYTLEPPEARCGGCGGKVGRDVLQQALAKLVIGEQDSKAQDSKAQGCLFQEADDAAVIRWSDAPTADLLVQSVDALKPLLDDPFLTGRISTLHALSDLYAMHATPHSAQVTVQVPSIAAPLQVRDLQQLMAGVQLELQRAGAQLVGGHTLEGESLQLGLTVNGRARPEHVLRKRGVRVAQALVLTKPLGSGALFAAHMRGFARCEWIDSALQVLLQSNQAAAQMCYQQGATALTDVTGFGLLGHLLEMLEGESFGARLYLAELPMLSGALACIQAGYTSTLMPANRRARDQTRLVNVDASDARYQLLFDPQTHGGLLAALPEAHVTQLLKDLRGHGYAAAVVGHCIAESGVEVLDNFVI